jgi:hypothetical protein
LRTDLSGITSSINGGQKVLPRNENYGDRKKKKKFVILRLENFGMENK